MAPALSLRFNSACWDWKLVLTLLVSGTIFQSIHSSYALFLIGNEIPSADGIAVLAQYKFIELAIEVAQEAFVLPMFYYLGLRRPNFESRLAVAFGICLAAMVILGIPFLLFTPLFVDLIATPPDISSVTVDYLRINYIANIASITAMLIFVVFKNARSYSLILFYQFSALTLNVVFNAIFIGGYGFSLGLGVLGAGLARLCAESTLLIFMGVVFFRRFDFVRLSKLSFGRNELKEYWRVIWGSGVDSFVRNLAYSAMILALINQMGADTIGGYYLAMHIIWAFGMIPIFIVSETMRILLNQNMNPTGVFKNSMLAAASVAVAWFFVGIFFWPKIAGFFNDDPNVVLISTQVVSILLFPYILLAFNLVADSVFYGSGRTEFLAYQSLIVNVFVYGAAYILYRSKIWIPDLDSVMILFSIGIVVDSILTAIFARVVLRKIAYRPSCQIDNTAKTAAAKKIR